jgi:serine/threonine protein kinase
MGPVEQIGYRDFLDIVFTGGLAAPTEGKAGGPDQVDKAASKDAEEQVGDMPSGSDEAKTDVPLDSTATTTPLSMRNTDVLDSSQATLAADLADDTKAATEDEPKEEEQDTKRVCEECGTKSGEITEDPIDGLWYCDRCWARWNDSFTSLRDSSSLFGGIRRLVDVVDGKLFADHELLFAWIEKPISNWPPRMPPSRPVNATDSDPTKIGKSLWPVKVTVNPGLVGSHARQNSCHDRPIPGEVLCEKYRIENKVGEGHFTRAYLATDITTDQKVCIKRHNGLTIELLTDLLTIGKRIESVDPEGKVFPRLADAFFDMVGYTVETLLEGRNCLEKSRSDPSHFKAVDNVRIVAQGGMAGLKLLSEAGVVHCDVKPDNIMWIDSKESGPMVRIVDFGCSRLDRRLESGRNWALAEGGAGHLGKWAPEMVLRLPISDRADVWGLAIALLELHCGRFMWNTEADTAEFMLAQSIGIANAQNGLPEDLLRRSPLDIRQLYTPHPNYFPVQRLGSAPGARHKELRPATWGLECVLGPKATWDDEKKVFADFETTALVIDHEERPSAAELLKHEFLSLVKP